MYMNFNKNEADEARKGYRFTYFSREVERNGEKVHSINTSVYGNVSEAIKTGEVNGSPVFEYDSYPAVFCGERAYEKALALQNKDKILVTEFNLRNRYSDKTKKSYLEMRIFDFEKITKEEVDGEGYMTVDENPFEE